MKSCMHKNACINMPKVLKFKRRSSVLKKDFAILTFYRSE